MATRPRVGEHTPSGDAGLWGHPETINVEELRESYAAQARAANALEPNRDPRANRPDPNAIIGLKEWGRLFRNPLAARQLIAWIRDNRDVKFEDIPPDILAEQRVLFVRAVRDPSLADPDPQTLWNYENPRPDNSGSDLWVGVKLPELWRCVQDAKEEDYVTLQERLTPQQGTLDL